MAGTNYPGALDDSSSLPNPGAGSFTNAPSHAGQHDTENDAIKAIEAKVGIGASTPSAGKVFRGTGTGTSAWGALDVTTDLTGILPVANGGTGLAVLTIPASAILVGTTDAQDVTNKTLHDTFMGETFMSQSATFRNVLLDASVNYLVTELVEVGAAFTLEVPATSTLEVRPFHGPQSFSSAQHDHTSAAGGGILPFAALLSTIFSGQVQTYTNTNTAGGTFYYVNLGGIKMLWGITAGITVAAGGGAAGFVNLPTGFFTATPQVAMSASSGNTGIANVYGSIDNLLTTSFRIIASNTGAASTAVNVSAFLIGV